MMSAITCPSTAVKFVEEPSSYVVCQLCKRVYTNPVINVKCGHTYCKTCLIKPSASGDSVSVFHCPEDGIECNVTELVLNRAIQDQVDDQDVYCRFGLKQGSTADEFVVDPLGCQAIVKYGGMKQHEDTCKYAVVACPNSNSEICGLHRRKSLQKHIDSCQHVPCPHRSQGCTFSGSSAAVLRHKITCEHSNLQLDTNSQQVSMLLSSFDELVKKMDHLTMRVDGLEQVKATQSTQLDNCLRLVQELSAKNDEMTAELQKLKTAMNSGVLQRVTSLQHGSPAMGRSSRPSSTTSVLGTTNRLESWNMPFQFKCIGTFRSHSGGVWSLQTSGSRVFSCGADCCIKTWDLDDLVRGCKTSVIAHSARVHTMAVGRSYLYSAGDDLTIKAWNLHDLTLHTSVDNAHDKTIAALVCTDDILFSSSYTVIKIWNSQTLSLVHVLQGLHHWVRSLALSFNKSRLYSGSHGTIDIWDVAGGKYNLVGKITHSYGSVHALAITDQYIVAGTYNQNIHIYDVITMQYVVHWTGHVGIINCIMVSPSGRFMFSSSSDSTIMVWSLEKMLPIQTLHRHSDSVNTLVINRDLLLSGSDDTEIKVFKYFHMQT